MRTVSRAIRRTGVVAASTLAFAGLPLAGALAASGTVTQAAPAFVANTGSATEIAFTLSSAPTSPAELLDVSLSGPASTTIADTGTPEVDGAVVSATFDLRGAAPGLYAVRVADLSGGTIDEYECASCLRVLASPPTVTGVTPTARGAGSPGATFAVTGTNFFTGVSVRFLREGTPDTAITFPSTGSLTIAADHRTVSGSLAVASTAVPGGRDVEVVNTDGQSAICGGCLTVVAAPSFVSLSPNTAGQGAVARTLALTGADFQPAMTAAFRLTGSATDAGGVTVTSFTVEDADSATLVLNVADGSDTASTTRDLVLTNPDGGTSRVANALTVTPEPRVTSLAPSTLDGSATDEDVVVTGTGLSADPSFTFSGSGIVVNGYTPDPSTPATKGVLDLSLDAGAAQSARTVTVVNPDGGQSTSGNVFTPGPTPTITNVSPPALGRGASGRALTITGTNFDDANGVSLAIPGVTLTNVVATSPTTITATASVPGSAELGMRDVSVLNVGSGRRGRATCTGCFSVDSFAVDSITPSAVLNSASYQVTIAGSSLPSGETITATLTRTIARAGQDPIEFTGVVNGDGTSFVGTVDVRDAAPGAYTVRLSHGDEVGTCGCSFNVVAETSPALSSVTPSTVPQGATGRTLRLKGSGFTRGADVVFNNSVTKVGDVTFVDATTLEVTVDVAENATVASVPVTVKIPAFGNDTEASCANCLAVTNRPVVSSSNQPSRSQGSPEVRVTLTGTFFQPGATVSIAGDGLTVDDVARTSDTAISFDLAVAEDAAPGARAVTVTNPDGGAGSCDCLTITARPVVTGVTPATGGQGRSGVSVTVAGSGFVSPATVSFGPDVVVQNVSGSGDALVATLDLTTASLGAHTVSVANPDGGMATCTCTFEVVVVPSVTSITPTSRGAGAQQQAVTIRGTSFANGAVPSFSDAGITVVDSDVVDATRIDAVVSIGNDVAPGTRNVVVTNVDTGQSGTCNACFTVNPHPTLNPGQATVQRNRTGRTMNLEGSGFTPGPVSADLGDGITVTNAQATSPTTVVVTFDVSNAAALGAHDVRVVNPDGGPATCTGCLTVTTPRRFTFALSDSTPKSGATQSVTVTAHVSSDDSSAVDTSYTGVPVLSAAGDTHFSSGACSTAVNGVSTCESVRFGDLGPVSLNASGTGADADLGGTQAVTVEPTALAFSPAAPTSAAMGSPTSFTVRPSVGVTGASIDDYAAPRTAHLTGHSPETVALTCAAVCTFSVTFTSTGTKTVRVSDDSSPNVSTPTVNVVAKQPTRIDSFRVSRSSVVAGESVTFRGTLRETTGAAVPGATVRIYVIGGGLRTWRYWMSATTDSTGAFAKTARMTYSRKVRVSFLPTATLAGTTAPQTLLVGVATRVTVSSPASGSTVAAGRTFTVRGSTWPGKPGIAAYLFWRRSDGRVVLLRRGTTDRYGRFALSRSLGRGTYRLQVGVPAASGNLSGRSAYFTLRVL